MKGRTPTRNQCEFWDCATPVRRSHFLGLDHYGGYENGQVDRCPDCERYKDAKYSLCLGCKSDNPQASTKSSKRYQREHSTAWEAGDVEATAFYIYVLKLNDGSFYAGQTREIRERLMEHRDSRTESTAGRDPKLVWFTVVGTRDEATRFESVVKKMCDQNPREIRRWIVQFQDIVKEVDLT